MKNKLLILMMSFYFVNIPVFAATYQAQSKAQLEKKVQKLLKRTQRLEHQLNVTKANLEKVKNRQRKVTKVQVQVKKAQAQDAAFHKSLRSQLYTLGATVTTSPFLRLRSAYDGSDLLVNYPTMNEDLRILKQRQYLANRLKGKVPYYYHPRLVLSGTAQGQVIYKDPYTNSDTLDVDLSSVELDTLAEVGPWAFGFISLKYDNTAVTGGSRIANSRVYLNRGFLTIGNLNRSPFYMSLGQMYVPFGRYKNYLVDAPITEVLGRTNQRALVLGIDKNGFYGQIYGFHGDTDIGREVQGGLNAGYRFDANNFNGNIGAGVIANMADSEGMRSTGGTFGGFGTSITTEKLNHGVPGLNGHAAVSWKHWSLMGEYIGALREFDSRNLAFNGHGAKPQAVDTEVGYSFKLSEKPVTLAVDYGYSWETLALNLPKQNIIGLMNISLWKNTIETIEYRHDINYSSGDTAAGQGTTVTVPGHDQNTVYAQVAVYF